MGWRRDDGEGLFGASSFVVWEFIVMNVYKFILFIVIGEYFIISYTSVCFVIFKSEISDTENLFISSR